MTLTEDMVEAAARGLCAYHGEIADHQVYYERSNYGPHTKRDPISSEYLGKCRRDGSIIEQWPTMPLWKWKRETEARYVLTAALAAHGKGESSK